MLCNRVRDVIFKQEMTMNLVDSLADPAKCQVIERPAYNSSPEVLDAWQNAANTLAFTYERILQLPSPSFWSSVVYNKTIMQSFDAVLEAIPRRFEIDEYRMVFGWDPSVAMAAGRLYNSALAIFLRVAVYNKKIDSSMQQKLYLEAVRDRGAMPVRRLTSALSFFSGHGQLMVEIARRRGLIDPGFSNDSAKICSELSETISNMEKDATRLVQEFYAREGVAKLRIAKLVDDWFCTIVALCRDGSAIVDILSQAGLLKDTSRYASSIPALVQCVDRLFTTEFIIDVAMTLSDYPLRRLLRLRTQVLQSGIDFYHTVLVRMSRDQKVATILSVLELERFIFLLNEKQNLLEVVEGCQKEQQDYIERALESACESQRTETVRELEKCGLLTFILWLYVITRDIQKRRPWCLLYADDVMLAAETREELEAEVWKDRLLWYRLRLNIAKTEYMEWGAKTEDKTICVDVNDLKKVECFKYL
ncbi:hypothetical protein ANCDUO_23074 [Ancylostoma duodenale]|uniref:Reverse transcriptase domain-containing protein n=1 Tax=Ancylostoma duodenale TaxID=51022 RepID=A0A0C2FJH1_9BILA|nr:hypothetical protein ANCDUO_23074 [Ancylostoma duodenale]